MSWRLMSPQPRRELPSYAVEVYDTLQPLYHDVDTGLPRDEIETAVEDEGFEPATVKAALDVLLNRGYLYDVNGELRITDDGP